MCFCYEIYILVEVLSKISGKKQIWPNPSELFDQSLLALKIAELVGSLGLLTTDQVFPGHW